MCPHVNNCCMEVNSVWVVIRLFLQLYKTKAWGAGFSKDRQLAWSSLLLTLGLCFSCPLPPVL